jgi:hypothetical protein
MRVEEGLSLDFRADGMMGKMRFLSILNDRKIHVSRGGAEKRMI